jgi:hypothetical protein
MAPVKDKFSSLAAVAVVVVVVVVVALANSFKKVDLPLPFLPSNPILQLRGSE